MNKENAHLYLPLVQALAEGKTIQFNQGDAWIDAATNADFKWLDSPDNYRVKPEPRTWSFWLDKKGNLWHYHITPLADWKRITVQEVLE